MCLTSFNIFPRIPHVVILTCICRLFLVFVLCSFNVPSSFTVPEGQFYLELHSSLKVSDVEAAFSGKSFEKRLASVLLGNANQYGPNNFVTENENQIPVCAGPPNGDFTTTRDDQNRVIKTIARLAMAAYKAHANGKGLAGLKRFIGRKDFVVEEVSVL